MQQNDSVGQAPSSNEMSVVDMINFFRRGWKTISTAGLIGLGAGTTYAFLSPQLFQAEALIQGGVVSGQPIEPAATLIEKLKQPTYYSPISQILCIGSESMQSSQELSRTIKATVVKNSPLVSITYKTHTADSAASCLNAVLSDIRRNQEPLPKPLIKAKEAQIQLAKQELDQSEKINHQLTKELNGNSNNSNAIISAIILSNQKTLLTTRKNIEAQEMELTPPQTQPATAVTPIYAPDTPVSPKKSLIMFGGLVAGLAISTVWLVARQVWQKIKQQLH